jgi:hypothetical protein
MDSLQWWAAFFGGATFGVLAIGITLAAIWRLTTRENQSRLDQPPPTANNSAPVWELVITDMRERDHAGRQLYGTPLQAGNGRDALIDAYQEALDLVVYLRQAIEERNQ